MVLPCRRAVGWSSAVIFPVPTSLCQEASTALDQQLDLTAPVVLRLWRWQWVGWDSGAKVTEPSWLSKAGVGEGGSASLEVAHGFGRTRAFAHWQGNIPWVVLREGRMQGGTYGLHGKSPPQAVHGHRAMLLESPCFPARTIWSCVCCQRVVRHGLTCLWAKRNDVPHVPLPCYGQHIAAAEVVGF